MIGYLLEGARGFTADPDLRSRSAWASPVARAPVTLARAPRAAAL